MTTSTVSKKHHLSKRELKEDKILSSIGRAIDYFNDHRMTILLALAAVVAAVLVVGLYKNSAKAGASRSEEILYLALSDYEAGRYREAANGLQQFVDRFPRHKRAAVAQTALGNAHLMLSETNEARTQFEKAAGNAPRGSAAWVAAKTGLGVLAVSQGMHEDAATLFEEAAEASESKEAGAEAMSRAIEARIAAGQGDAAKALLEKATKDYAGTRAAQTFPKYQGQLDALGS
jgi:TolA-binding protein